MKFDTSYLGVGQSSNRVPGPIRGRLGALPLPQECHYQAGTDDGSATMFQEAWVFDKTGACGFPKPNSVHAEGFFTAVGSGDWEEGFACGTCAEVEYKGTVITVNVVDKGHGTKGWFDLGGLAWRALTKGALPDRFSGVKSRWVACPDNLTMKTIQVYVKPGSQPWDARFQPMGNTLPIRSMWIDGGSGWQEMKKCENYMFCKPSGVILNKGEYAIRVTSDTGNIDTPVVMIMEPPILEGVYIDTKTNNGGTGTCAPGS
eukprot:GFUD01107092.1.p1 GENE.GFUD01107092.1~~GFUD01107092.1.p1  ORF type:complete len:281 (+),score=29.57 GFUD01107092.1:69-845(+)